LIEIKCSPHLKLLLCSVYAPICTPLAVIIHPCRSLCQSARNGCESIMKQYGHEWPINLDCARFPQKNNGQICIDVEKKQSTLRTTKRPTFRKKNNRNNSNVVSNVRLTK
ncbi:frizzled-2-like protein, partial [Leptotrombidium deliense]